jgi:hypothetical protein
MAYIHHLSCHSERYWVIKMNEFVWVALRYATCFAILFQALVLKDMNKAMDLSLIFKVYFAEYHQIANENFPWRIDLS